MQNLTRWRRIVEQQGCKFILMTILRNPVERLLSQIFYSKTSLDKVYEFVSQSQFSVDGLDAILVGPYDLSASMNLTGDFNHEDYNKILKKIINLSKKYNIPCGNHIVNSDSKEIIKSIEDGFRFIAYCTDGIFLNDSSTISNTLNI